MSFWGQMRLQDAATPTMEGLLGLYDTAMVVLIFVICVVSYGLICVALGGFNCRTILDSQEIEIVWTVIPGAILFCLAFPSLLLLYTMDEVSSPCITVKSVGHQWYWSYEYSDFSKSLEFDSYMVPSEELPFGGFRLLEVDHRVVLPVGVEVRVLVTAADVIHSWAIPSFGVKVDAIPGRLNQVGFLCSRVGVFYGQCSEICGANHSFMPIAVEVVGYKAFVNWVEKFCS